MKSNRYDTFPVLRQETEIDQVKRALRLRKLGQEMAKSIPDYSKRVMELRRLDRALKVDAWLVRAAVACLTLAFLAMVARLILQFWK